MNFIDLVVEGINQEGNRIIIKSGGKSYSFFVTKQDGTQSRAYQDYMKGVQIGKNYSFGVTESMGKSKDGRDIVYRNIGVISPYKGDSLAQTPSTTQEMPQQTHCQPKVIPNQPQAQIYQTMSDFEVKILAELRRLSDGYEKLYNEIKVIRLGMPEENRPAMDLYSNDNILKDCQDKGLEPKSLLEEELPTTEETPF